MQQTGNSINLSVSLADLRTQDATARERTGESRFLCPLPDCAEHRNPAKHRSFAVNMQTGAWHCHRCHGRGLLIEWQTERPQLPPANRRAAARARSLSRFVLPDPPKSEPAPDEKTMRSAILGAAGGKLLPLTGTPGETYLTGRGLDAEMCRRAYVRFAPNWYGRSAVVFPIRDGQGVLVAAQGRYIDGQEPRMRTCGDRKAGLFQTENALAALRGDSFAPIVFCEAPIDALSLHACGVSAVALCGSNHFPDWLLRRCFNRDVWAAFDADDAGDKAARELADALRLRGAILRRVRPTGAKDWNESLQSIGRDRLAALLHGAAGEFSDFSDRGIAPVAPVAGQGDTIHPETAPGVPQGQETALNGHFVGEWQETARRARAIWHEGVSRADVMRLAGDDTPPALLAAVLCEWEQAQQDAQSGVY